MNGRPDDDQEILTRYLREIGDIPLLDREEEEACARRAARGDEEAKALLVRANLRFVVAVAKRYRTFGLPLEDLISEGSIGLMHAIDRFDPELGYHFISYAVWWIRQSIVRALGQSSRMIRLPSHRIKELTHINRLRADTVKASGTEPTIEELAGALNLEPERVSELLAISRSTISLDSPMDRDDEATLGDFIVDGGSGDVDRSLMGEALRRDIDDMLATLSDREAAILRDRFGLNGGKPQSLMEIGDRHHLTKERIRQIEQRALRKLRHSAFCRRLRTYLR